MMTGTEDGQKRMDISREKPTAPPYYYDDDEITLKELILKIKLFGSELWVSKWLIVGVTLLFMLGFLGKAVVDKTTYESGLRFLLSGAKQNTQALSEFEFVELENNKITELARSGRIVHEVLLSQTLIDNKFDFIANHIIDLYNFHDKWKEEPIVEEYRHLHLGDFYFEGEEISSFTQREYRALNLLHEFVSGSSLSNTKGVMEMSYDLKSEIFTLTVETVNDNLSMILSKTLFERLREFYVEETVGRPQRMYKLVKAETDSLYNELYRVERQLAGFNDRDRGLISGISRLPKDKIIREVSIVNEEYNASLRRKRGLELLLTSDTPEFQIIDQTFIPIKKEPSRIKALLIGLFLGGFLASLYIIFRRIYRDAMAS